MSVNVGNISDPDGVGGVLGGAGWTTLDTTKFLPLSFDIVIDSSDLTNMYNEYVDDGRTSLYYFFVHEISHGLGLGSLWNQEFNHPNSSQVDQDRKFVVNKNTLQPLLPANDTNYPNKDDYTAENPVYIGQHGVEAYKKILLESGWDQSVVDGITYFAIEDGGQFGTIGVHPEEDDRDGMEGFEHEVSTGYLTFGAKQPLSRLTIALFKDLGWKVDENLFEKYNIT